MNATNATRRDTGWKLMAHYLDQPPPMRSLEEIRADILALEKETDGLLEYILVDIKFAPPGQPTIHRE